MMPAEENPSGKVAKKFTFDICHIYCDKWHYKDTYIVRFNVYAKPHIHISKR
jgi:hypothetical protein